MNKHMSNLTLNWHFTSLCNMNCKYCFAPKTGSLTEEQLFLILKKIDSGIFNRINFVGGEPTASKYLLPLLSKSKDLGFKTSIVTNGYKMIHDSNYTDLLLPYLDMVGLSVDSLHPKTNAYIGRSSQNNIISKKEYNSLCVKINKTKTPLKINTVVSKANFFQDFNSFYAQINPSRIKIFQVLEPNTVLKHDYKDLLVSDKEFNQFVERHSQFKDRMCVENNEMMTNSYIQLNSEGCFSDNKTGVISPSLLEKNMTVLKAMKNISLDIEKYNSRYQSTIN